MQIPRKRFRLKGLAAMFAIALSACFLGPGAIGVANAQSAGSFGPAVDWSVIARLRQTMQADTNRSLSSGDDELEAQSVTSLNLTVGARTKQTQVSVQSGIAAGFSTDSDRDNLNRIDPNILATAIYSGKLFQLQGRVSAQSRPTSVTEVDDSGATTADASRRDLNASIGASWQVSPRDRVSLTTSADIVDFSRNIGSLTPSQTFGVTAGWSRAATKTTGISFSTGFRHFDSDGGSGRNSRIFNFRAGVSHRRTSRHTFGLQVGGSLVDTDLANGASSTTIGFSGGASFDYNLDNLKLGLNIDQSIQPSSDGDVTTVTRLTSDLAYRINQLQSLGFSISYVRRSDVAGASDVIQVLTVSPSYRYSLGKNTDLSLGYQFRVRDDDNNDFVTGHRVLLTLAHQLTLLQ